MSVSSAEEAPFPAPKAELLGLDRVRLPLPAPVRQPVSLDDFPFSSHLPQAQPRHTCQN
jgi:hypothetical protein